MSRFFLSTTVVLCWLMLGGIAVGLDITNTGDVSYTGGDVNDEYGVEAYSFSNSGVVMATGGSGDFSSGINSESIFTNSGTVIASGGGGNGAHGVAAGSFTNSGTVTATGGGGENAFGIASVFTFTNSGTVTASGGGGDYAGGIASVFFTNSSIVTASGGSGERAYGIYSESSFTNSGNVTATGGGGENAHGIHSNSTFTNSGTVTATGGSMKWTYGIYSDSSFTNSGNVTASGGGGDGAHGVNAGSFINSGTMTATGGGGKGAKGIHSDATFTNSGTVTAVGGSGENAHGVGTSSNFSNTGTVIAAGGSGHEAHGIRPFFSFFNSGLVIMAAGGGANAVFASTSPVFNPGSTLALAGGTFYTGIAITTPENGRVTSLTAATLAPGEEHFHENFIQGTGGTTPLDHTNTPTLNYDDYTANGEHSVTVRRTAYASSFANGGGAHFLAGLEQGFLGMSEAELANNLPYALILSKADHQASGAAIRDFANRASRELSPQGTANLMAGFARAGRLASSMLSNGLVTVADMDDMDGAQAATAVSAGSAYASLSPVEDRAVHGWFRPLYQHGRLNGEAGYSDLRENIGGASFGAAWRRGTFAFGLSGHYLHANVNGGSAYDAQYNGFGVNAGGAYNLDLGRFNPLLSFTLGYTHFDIDQSRTTGMEAEIMPGNPAMARYGSEPDADLYSATIALSERLQLCGGTLRPMLGLEYAHTRLGGDNESGSGVIPWNLSSSSMNSWQGVVGASYARPVSERVTLTAKAQYRYEFGDKHGVVRAQGALGGGSNFRFLGQDGGRSSAVLGVGIAYRVHNRARLALDYDLNLSRRYHGHQASATLAVEF